MIYFKTVRWKNFLATGNLESTIFLDRAVTTLVIGENGAGKSTVLDALCFDYLERPIDRLRKHNWLIPSIRENVK